MLKLVNVSCLGLELFGLPCMQFDKQLSIIFYRTTYEHRCLEPYDGVQNG